VGADRCASQQQLRARRACWTRRCPASQLDAHAQQASTPQRLGRCRHTLGCRSTPARQRQHQRRAHPLGRLDLDQVDGLAQARLGRELRGVHGAARGGDDLPAAAVDGVGVHDHVVDLKHAATHVLLGLGGGGRGGEGGGGGELAVCVSGAPAQRTPAHRQRPPGGGCSGTPRSCPGGSGAQACCSSARVLLRRSAAPGGKRGWAGRGPARSPGRPPWWPTAWPPPQSP
jgi:hypothetical protein